MAVAFDAATSATIAASASSTTHSHTVTTGSDLALFVCAFWMFAFGNTTVSSVTYNGVAMTDVSGGSNIGTDDFGNEVGAVWYYLVNPATGANNVVATLNATVDLMTAGACSFTGVDQTTPHGTAAIANGTTTTPAVSPASATDEHVIGACVGPGGTAAEITTGDTEMWERVDASQWAACGARAAGAAPTVTIDWAGWVPFGGRWRCSGVSVKAAGAAAGQPTSKRWGGVPFMGGRSGGVWAPARNDGTFARRRSGIFVPQRFKEAA